MIAFFIGVRDSLSIRDSFIRYLFPKSQQGITLVSAFKQIFASTSEEAFE